MVNFLPTSLSDRILDKKSTEEKDNHHKVNAKMFAHKPCLMG
jgi:hypothetical protein